MKSFPMIAVLAVTVSMLSACQTVQREAGAPSGPLIYVKESMDGSSAVSDFNACSSQARNAPYERVEPVSSGGGLIGAITAGVIAGIINGNRQAEASRQAWNRCMTFRQYQEVAIPDNVFAAYKDAETDDDKATVIDTWIASPAYLPINAWFDIEHAGDAPAFRGYLAQYPDGDFRHAALTRAFELDQQAVTLDSVRERSFLKGRFRYLKGLYSNGWNRSGNHDQGPIDCFKSKARADIFMKIENGSVSGVFKPETVRRSEFSGSLSEDGTLTFRTVWPRTDPVVFEGHYVEAGLFEGTISNLRGDACEQPIWFEVFPPAETEMQALMDLKEETRLFVTGDKNSSTSSWDGNSGSNRSAAIRP